VRRAVGVGISLIIVLWLQVGFFGGLRLFGVVPNLLLIALTYWALNRQASEALTAALIGGLVLDFASGSDFGLRLAFYSFYALGVMYLRQRGAGQSVLVISAALATGTILFNLVVLSTRVAKHLPND